LAQTAVIIRILAVDRPCDNQTTEEAKADCAGTVSAVVAAAANAVSYIASAAQRCGPSVKGTAGTCAGDIAGLVNTFSGLASGGSQFLLVCSPVIAEGNDFIGRRMSTGNYPNFTRGNFTFR